MEPEPNKCPLSGKSCSKPKMFHITELDGSDVKSYHLCSDCGNDHVMHEKVFKQNHSSEILSYFASIIDEVEKDIKNRKCPGCGFTLIDIGKKHRLGCPQCYKTFEKEVGHLISNAHNAIKHVGKVPKTWAKKTQFCGDGLVRHVKQLKETMQEAIKVENYELCAKLKIQLAKLSEISVLENEKTKNPENLAEYEVKIQQIIDGFNST